VNDRVGVLADATGGAIAGIGAVIATELAVTAAEEILVKAVSAAIGEIVTATFPAVHSQEFAELLDSQACIAHDAPIVNAFTGLWRGIVMMRDPSVMTTCLPWRAIRNPAFSSAPKMGFNTYDYVNGNIALRLLGSLKLFCRDGQLRWTFSGALKAFDDLTDYEKGKRGFLRETATAIGRHSNGKEFYIQIRGQKGISERGSIP
jgi:hypothetical protein